MVKHYLEDNFLQFSWNWYNYHRNWGHFLDLRSTTLWFFKDLTNKVCLESKIGLYLSIYFVVTFSKFSFGYGEPYGTWKVILFRSNKQSPKCKFKNCIFFFNVHTSTSEHKVTSKVTGYLSPFISVIINITMWMIVIINALIFL